MDLTGKILSPCADIGKGVGWDVGSGLASSSLLIHSDTTDGSTTFVDSVGTHSPVAGAADVEHDTAQSRFGKTSILFDGDSGYITIPDHADWDFDSGIFTIDFWVRFNSIVAEQTLFSQYVDGDNYYRLWWDQGNTELTFDSTGGGNVINLNYTWSPSVNIWYHIALIRGWGGNANDWAITVNGKSIGSETNAADINNLAAALFIGRHGAGGGAEEWFNGWIDEFRVSKGVARWTKNFIPPYGSYR